MDDKSIFNNKLKEIGFTSNKNQAEYFETLNKFLRSEDKYILMKGGMALGKTLCSIIAIKLNLNNFDKWYIAVPFAATKDSWMNDLNKIGLKYSPWISKSNCVSRYHSDTADCNDECEHRNHLEKNGEYSSLCRTLNKLLIERCPITASEYYHKYGDKDCLWPIIKFGLKYKNINIGDFFPIFIPLMIENMIFSLFDSNNSIIFFDECQRFIPRVRDFYSRRITIDNIINGLEKELILITTNENLYSIIFKIIGNLKKWKDKFVNKLKKDGKNESRYSYNDFLKDYSNISNEENSFETLLISLKEMSILTKTKDTFETKDDMRKCRKFYDFLEKWKENTGNNSYKSYSEFLDYNQKLRLNLICIDVQDKVPSLLKRYKKVIFMSGTVGTEFKNNTGLKELKTSNEFESYNISDNVCIYPKYDFSSKKRKESILNIKEELNLIIKEMMGRIFIFLPSTFMAEEVESIINTKKPIFNICNKKQEEKSRILKSFTKSKDGICLYGINQGIDGQNILGDEESELPFSVENSITLGYPFRRKGIFYDDELQFLINKYEDIKLARRLHEYIPVGRNLHQALTRLKRFDYDYPCNILIGEQFTSGEMYNCLPLELKKNIIEDLGSVLNFIKIKNEKRDEKSSL